MYKIHPGELYSGLLDQFAKRYIIFVVSVDIQKELCYTIATKKEDIIIRWVPSNYIKNLYEKVT